MFSKQFPKTQRFPGHRESPGIVPLNATQGKVTLGSCEINVTQGNVTLGLCKFNVTQGNVTLGIVQIQRYPR